MLAAKHMEACLTGRGKRFLMTRLGVVVGISLSFIVYANQTKAGICGVGGGSVGQIQANTAKSKTFKLNGGNALYVSYMNPKTLITLTFTKPANEAHPAIACRRAFLKGDAWFVTTHIRCSASKNACNVLKREFDVLDAQMKRALNNQ
jgi:hypothetical protein